MGTVFEPDAKTSNERAALFAAQQKIEAEAAERRRAEEIRRCEANEKAASEQHEQARAKVLEADAICRRLVDAQNEVEARLRGTVFLLETEEVERLLLRQMALNKQAVSLNVERPSILSRYREADIAHSKAKQRLADARES